MRLCYVRFGCAEGPFPANERSLNSLTGELEPGVSVYEALVRDGNYQILLPPLSPTTITTLGMCYNCAQGLHGLENSPIYEVEGDRIGTGSDGEPLLINCRVVRKVFHLTLEHYAEEWAARPGVNSVPTLDITEELVDE